MVSIRDGDAKNSSKEMQVKKMQVKKMQVMKCK